jgi:hypothetical protein
MPLFLTPLLLGVDVDQRPLFSFSCRSISRLMNWSRLRWEQLQ